MRIPRYFAGRFPRGPLEGTLLPLPAGVLHHATRVLRLGSGAPIGLFDGAGQELRALLVPGPGRELQARAVALEPALDRNAPARVVAFSAPRGVRLESLVEQATELGATELIVLLAGRTPPRSRSVRLDRLERVAEGACAQCGRARLPSLLGPLPLETYLERPDLPPHRILLDPGGPHLQPAPPGEEVALLIGPEGGLAEEEIRAAEAAGFLPRSLGKLTLRVETAVAAALARLLPARGAPPS